MDTLTCPPNERATGDEGPASFGKERAAGY